MKKISAKKNYRDFFDIFCLFSIVPLNIEGCIEQVDIFYDVLCELEKTPENINDDVEEDIVPEFFIDTMKESLKEGVMEEVSQNRDRFFRENLPSIDMYSVLCHLLFPEHFFPYFFNTRFNHLKDIFSLFSILMPPLPGKTNYEKRFDYYFELCKV